MYEGRKPLDHMAFKSLFCPGSPSSPIRTVENEERRSQEVQHKPVSRKGDNLGITPSLSGPQQQIAAQRATRTHQGMPQEEACLRGDCRVHLLTGWEWETWDCLEVGGRGGGWNRLWISALGQHLWSLQWDMMDWESEGDRMLEVFVCYRFLRWASCHCGWGAWWELWYDSVRRPTDLLPRETSERYKSKHFQLLEIVPGTNKTR